jgi:hypothetical protein
MNCDVTSVENRRPCQSLLISATTSWVGALQRLTSVHSKTYKQLQELNRLRPTIILDQ